MEAPALYSGSEDAWKQLCERNDIDLVYIATDWKHHTEMGIYAMEHGNMQPSRYLPPCRWMKSGHLSILPKRPVNTVCNLKTVFTTSSN